MLTEHFLNAVLARLFNHRRTINLKLELKYMSPIKNNLASIHKKIAKACVNAQRNSTDVQLLAVSKTKPSEQIIAAYHAGQRSFGESYIQEAVEKISAISNSTTHSDITWHFIGPIQSNKTKAIATYFNWVQSVERIKIAQRLNNQRCELMQVNTHLPPLNICIQLNISDEASKSGISLSELPALAEYVNNAPGLCLRGLMAIPEKNAKAGSFIAMRKIFNELAHSYPSLDTLSMGMSNDMETAIEHGSTMVRVGSAIFGARNN